MSARVLTFVDIDDIAGEQTSDSQRWMRDEGISIDAMLGMLESSERSFAEKVAQDGDSSGALIDIAGQAFRLGWEAHKRVAA